MTYMKRTDWGEGLGVWLSGKVLIYHILGPEFYPQLAGCSFIHSFILVLSHTHIALL